MRTPTAKLYLDTRVQFEESPDTYPVSIQFYFDRKRKNVSTGFRLSNEDFKTVLSGSPRTNELKEIKSNLDKAIHKAQTIIQDLKHNFTLERAKNLFLDSNYQTDKYSVFTGFDTYIHQLTEKGQIATAKSYQCAKNSLKEFSPVLGYRQITPEFLEAFEDWFVGEKHKSRTTLGIYLRSLRTILNQALKNELINAKIYPFGKNKYIIPTGKNTKRALTIEDIRQIKDYFTIPGSPSDKAKDFFLFSYLSNGINFKDIARLKNKDIKNNQIHFVRAKTEKTRRDYTPIKTSLRPETLAIIEKWRNPDTSPDSFLFPILEKGITPNQEYLRIKKFVKITNKRLIDIGEALNLPLKLTTYVARHSFATIALNKGGARIEEISQFLGHSSILTTQKYIDSFEDKRIKEITDSLL